MLSFYAIRQDKLLQFYCSVEAVIFFIKMGVNIT